MRGLLDKVKGVIRRRGREKEGSPHGIKERELDGVFHVVFAPVRVGFLFLFGAFSEAAFGP